jgi:uncharacterized membrane protein
MSKRTWDVVSLAAIGGAGGASLALYDRLPQEVPTHFDLHGQPNGWMSRPWAASFLLIFTLALWIFIRFVRKLLPRSDKARLTPELAAVVAMLTAVFLSAVHVLILRIAIAPGVDVTTSVYLLVGVLFVTIGLVLPRVRRNPIIGVRTPWTLRSDENWARTQRVAGYTMVLGGIGAAAAGAAGGVAGGIAAFTCLAAASLFPVIYSLHLARRNDVG